MIVVFDYASLYDKNGTIAVLRKIIAEFETIGQSFLGTFTKIKLQAGKVYACRLSPKTGLQMDLFAENHPDYPDKILILTLNNVSILDEKSFLAVHDENGYIGTLLPYLNRDFHDASYLTREEIRC